MPNFEDFFEDAALVSWIEAGPLTVGAGTLMSRTHDVGLTVAAGCLGSVTFTLAGGGSGDDCGITRAALIKTGVFSFVTRLFDADVGESFGRSKTGPDPPASFPIPKNG